MRGVLSFLLLETGRWEEAGGHANAVVSRSTDVVSVVTATMVRGRLETRTGATPKAAAEAWQLAEPSGEAQRVLVCAAGLAEAAWTRDDPDDIRRRVDTVWDLAVARGNPWDVGELLWWLHHAGRRPSRRSAPPPPTLRSSATCAAGGCPCPVVPVRPAVPIRRG
jgi:hypothetical protein